MQPRVMHWTARLVTGAVIMALPLSSTGLNAASADPPPQGPSTPIEHLIVVVGENRTFDHVYGGYQSSQGETIRNLLSRGIILSDGSAGPNVSAASQAQANDVDTYKLAPPQTGPYATLPQPNTTYASGLPQNVPDARFPANLPNAPFQITKYVPYSAFTGDPVHRFFQMWQQYDKGRLDLFVWVAQTVGIGPQNSPPVPSPGNTFQGALAMGFYNMSTGDAPLFRQLADKYAISDNYHQAIMGGTGANFFALATGDVAFYNTNGTPTPPPANQIENPNPQPMTNNFYTQDGYRGGSYIKCADATQPGIGAIQDYLASLPNKPFRNGNCEKDTYYLVNNYSPGYTPTGQVKPLGPQIFTVPPQTVPSIAEALSAKGVSWKWYTGGRNNGNVTNEYCTICDPFTHLTAVMTTNLIQNLQDVTQFYEDVKSDATLPAVSFVRPFESHAGHPANSTLQLYEGFLRDLIQRVQNSVVWSKTAILITFDEGGGYYDSGYIQPLDVFGDGTRTVLVVVSPHAKPGHVDHTYSDHVSILKFIEKNWGLAPLSNRSRDNLPNPVASDENPYVPVNGPAIGDLMSLFNFGNQGDNTSQ